MRLTAMVAMAAVTGICAQAGQTVDQVTVYLSDNASVPDLVRVRAEGISTTMFARIGVRVDWRLGRPAGSASSGALGIELAAHTPTNFLPGALAYALPFEGVHIRVFWDRMQGSPIQTLLLAHVFAHEITHILEGTDRHSETGVMKAHWTGDDLAQMQLTPLPFAEEDVALIRRGLEVRSYDTSTLHA